MSRKLKVYLSGAVKNVDDEFQNWRDKCSKTSELAAIYDEIEFVDPMKYYDYKYHKPETDKQCLSLFMWLIDKCDVVLVNLDNSDSSVGTGMELEHASNKNIPIVGFGEDVDTWYNWAIEKCDVVLDSLGEAVNSINYMYARMV